MTLSNKVQQFSDDADTLHAIVHGPADGDASTVATEGGARRTLAKIDADLNANGNVAAVLSARAAAEAARDAANSSGRAYTSAQGTAAALADNALAVGLTFAVVAADGMSFTVYRKDAGPLATLMFVQYAKGYLDSLVRASTDQAQHWQRWSDDGGFVTAILDALGLRTATWSVGPTGIDNPQFALKQNSTTSRALKMLDEYGFAAGYFDGTEMRRLTDAVQPTKLDLLPFTIQAANAATRFAVSDGNGYFAVHVASNKAIDDTSQLANDVAALKAGTIGGGNGSLSAFIPTTRARTIAHRGLHVYNIAPENSLDALYYTARAGFQYTETDIQKTQDGQFIILHDNTVDRTCRNAADYSAVTTAIDTGTMTLATIRANYVLASTEPRQRRPIPTLAEYCAACRDLGLHPVLELKDWRLTNADISAIYGIARQYLGEDGFSFTSFFIGMLDYARTLGAKHSLYYMYDPVSSTPAGALTNAAIDNIKAHAPAAAYISWNQWTPDLVAYAKQQGVPVTSWVVPPEQFDTLTKLGLTEFAADTLAPPLDGQKVVFRSYSDLTFSDFTTNGTIANGVLALAQGQTLVFAKPTLTAVDFGGFYLGMDLKGAATISATNLNATPSNAGADWVAFGYQGLMRSTSFGMTITAGAGGCQVKDLRLAAAQF